MRHPYPRKHLNDKLTMKKQDESLKASQEAPESNGSGDRLHGRADGRPRSRKSRRLLPLSRSKQNRSLSPFRSESSVNHANRVTAATAIVEIVSAGIEVTVIVEMRPRQSE